MECDGTMQDKQAVGVLAEVILSCYTDTAMITMRYMAIYISFYQFCVPAVILGVIKKCCKVRLQFIF